MIYQHYISHLSIGGYKFPALVDGDAHIFITNPSTHEATVTKLINKVSKTRFKKIYHSIAANNFRYSSSDKRLVCLIYEVVAGVPAPDVAPSVADKTK